MKKTIAFVLVLAMALGCVGCGSVFSSEYYYSEPFLAETSPGDGTETEIRNASTLKRAILELIYAGETQAQFRFGSYTGSLLDDLAAVCLEIKSSTPIGAYAVEDISYDTSRIVSYYTADISIRYKKSVQEIASVVEVSGLGELGAHLLSAVEQCLPETVVQIYSSAANEEYIKDFIADSYYSDPLLAAMEPTVTVAAFPEAGTERIYAIYLRYDAAPEQMGKMLKRLSLRVDEIAAGVEEDSALNRALRCAELLSEFCAGEDEQVSWPYTAYSALVEGSGHPYGMAMAYKALCDKLAVPCQVVRGERRDGGGAAHAWNIIEIDGEYYHVDVSRFYEGVSPAFLLSDEDIWGEYDWEREKYPACSGSLGPEDVFEIPAAQPEETLPEESLQPENPEESPAESETPETPEESPEPEPPLPTEPVE